MSISPDVEPRCYGSEMDLAVTPIRRKKNTIKRGQALLFLLFLGFTAFSLYEVRVASSDASYQDWIAAFVISALLTLYIFFYDNRRRRRRGRYGTSD